MTTFSICCWPKKRNTIQHYSYNQFMTHNLINDNMKICSSGTGFNIPCCFIVLPLDYRGSSWGMFDDFSKKTGCYTYIPLLGYLGISQIG